jgi:hypothetical protein
LRKNSSEGPGGVLLGYAKSSTGVRQSRTGRFCALVFFEILGERVFPQPR